LKPVTAEQYVGEYSGDPCPSEGIEKGNNRLGTGKAGDLAQFRYLGYKFTFNPKNVTKIAWSVNADNNSDVQGENIEVLIDDVVLKGSYTYVNPSICTGCVDAQTSIPTPSQKMSDFEGSDALQNELGYYWYHYDDAKAGGNSTISEEWLIPGYLEGSLVMNTTDRGKDWAGNGAFIEFITDANFISTAKGDVRPFVGIGVNLSDSLEIPGGSPKYLDASGFTGIYFNHSTGAGVEYVDVEITDKNDHTGYAADNDGEVFFTKIKGSTAGEWHSAYIKWSDLVLPKWAKENGERRKGQTYADLKLNQLSGIKFKIQGTGISGHLAIDNLYFVGSGTFSVGTRYAASSKVRAEGLRATYARGVVGVNWGTAQNIKSGKVSLVNVKGRTVAAAPLTIANGKVTANLSKGTIPTGMYLVRVNAKDVQGKKVVQQVPLTIVK
jgi:hypothetical protein